MENPIKNGMIWRDFTHYFRKPPYTVQPMGEISAAFGCHKRERPEDFNRGANDGCDGTIYQEIATLYRYIDI